MKYLRPKREQMLAEGRSVEAKACKKCGEAKPLMHFSLQKSGVDGRRSICRACERERVSDDTKRKRINYLTRATGKLV